MNDGRTDGSFHHVNIRKGIAGGEDKIMNVKSKQGSNASSPRADPIS